MTRHAFRLLAADGIVLPRCSTSAAVPLAPAHIRDAWRQSAARLRDAIAAGEYRANAAAIADGLLARCAVRYH